MLAIVRDEAAILASVSRSDGIMKPVETSAMLDYLLWRIERHGIYPTDDEAENIRRYLERLRPGPDAIDRAVRNLGNLDHRTLARMFGACVAVMDADGVRRREERNLINSLAVELTGVSLF
ncbi:Tellurite resistance protein TerB [Rhizobium sp. RU36D]|nr:Tellurite resistance protein TerB [Rhizobium sp. RU36D]